MSTVYETGEWAKSNRAAATAKALVKSTDKVVVRRLSELMGKAQESAKKLRCS